MVSKIFLDANVILDFALKRKNQSPALEIIDRIVNGPLMGFITPSILQISGYWISKQYDTSIAKKVLTSLCEDVRVVECSHDVAMLALNSKLDDIEDAIQYYTAIEYKLDAFISSDKLLKKSSSPILPVYSPKEFLALSY